MEKHLIIFIGIQASGKTSFYKKYFSDNYAHISLDVLHTRNKENLAVQECIKNNVNFVVDNTNPTKKEREKYIILAKKYNYKVVGYYFKSNIAKCIKRNENRQGKARIPDCAIPATFNKLELPDYTEGFDELYYVYMNESEMIVDKCKSEE